MTFTTVLGLGFQCTGLDTIQTRVYFWPHVTIVYGTIYALANQGFTNPILNKNAEPY